MKSRTPGVLNNDRKTQKKPLFYLMDFFTEHPESVGETYLEHFFCRYKIFFQVISFFHCCISTCIYTCFVQKNCKHTNKENVWANDLPKVIINIKFYRFDNLNYFLSYQLTVTSQ